MSSRIPNQIEQTTKLKRELKILKNILNLITSGASGFDLAYEMDNNNFLTTNFNFDGINFYKMFLKIGNKSLIDIPDKKESNYTSFKTIEYTQKGRFMMWLKENINHIEEILKPTEDYDKYLKERRRIFEIKTDYGSKQFIYCTYCGAQYEKGDLKYCEKCGYILL